MYLLTNETTVANSGRIMEKTSIIKIIEAHAPLHVQASWDSSGVQIESVKHDFSHIAVMLDPSIESIEKALALGCDFVLSHHPLAMQDYRLNQVNALFTVSSMLMSKQAMLYSAHTSLDATKHKAQEKSAILADYYRVSKDLKELKQAARRPDAFHDTLHEYYDNVNAKPFVSTWLAQELELVQLKPLDAKDNFGIVGTLKKASNLSKISKKILQFMPYVSLKDFRYIALDSEEAKNREVNTIAICTGSAASLYHNALLSEADLYITGDVKYHDALDALQSIPLQKSPPILLDVGHFSLEEEMMRRFSIILANEFDEHRVKVSFISAKNPYSYL